MIGAKLLLKCGWFVGVAALLALGGQQAFADDRPPLDVHDHEAMAALVKDLGSGDFTIRERAQKRLETVPAGQKEDLRQLARECNDPEVQARLLVRVEMIEEIAATDPPPISLDLQDASLETVAAQLSKALGTPVLARGGNIMDRFSISARDLPFWEIQRRLSQQHPVGVEMSGLSIYLVGGQSWRSNVVMRGLTVGISDLRRQQAGGNILVQGNGGVIQIINGPAANGLILNAGVINFAPANGAVVLNGGLIKLGQGNVIIQGAGLVPAAPAGTKLTGVLTVAADPRAHLLGITGPDLVQVEDDAGHRLLPPGAAAPGSSPPTLTRSNSWMRSFALDTPEKMGRSIKVLRGQAVISVALEEKRIELTDLSKHIGEVLYRGEQEVVLQDFSATDANFAGAAANANTVRLQLRVNDVPSIAFGGIPAAINRPPMVSTVRAVLTDANGMPLTNMIVPFGTSGTSFRGNFTPPLKLVVTVPEKIKNVVVPFEFKNVPIPPEAIPEMGR